MSFPRLFCSPLDQRPILLGIFLFQFLSQFKVFSVLIKKLELRLLFKVKGERFMVNLEIFQLYHCANTLTFNEMIMLYTM